MSKVIAPIMFLIMAAGLFFTYLRPAYDTLVALQVQEERLDRALTDSKELSNKTQELLTRYKDFSKTEITRLEAILPDVVDPVRVIINVDTMAKKSGVQLRSFDLPTAATAQPVQVVTDESGLAAPPPPYVVHRFRVECRGTYAQLKSFLGALESSLTLLDITDVRVETAKDEDTAPLTYAVSFSTYSLN